MILPSLIKYYDRLEADPTQDVAPLGFSRQRVSFCVVLNPDGTLDAIEDVRRPPESGSSKVVAQQMIVPGQTKSSGSGLNPCFLWDSAAYMLGFKPDDPKPERTRSCFNAFRDRHIALRDEIDDDAFRAVCDFLNLWNPAGFSPDPSLAGYLGNSGVFRVRPALEHVHERPIIKDWWLHSESASPNTAKSTADLVPSLITGRSSRIARIHEPGIKGVRSKNPPPGGSAKLVSFDKDAFTSYGKSQGMNAPVAEDDAFKYCTALNRLLDDRTRRTGIGDATVVWWSDKPEPTGETLVGALFGAAVPEEAPPDAEDAAVIERVNAAMGLIVRGLPPEDLGNSRTPFHVLGLSPNAARLSVRFWWDGTLGEITRNIASHHADLRLDPVHPPRDEARPFSIRRIVTETARQHGGKPDADTVSPTLAGEVARAIITGAPYPMSLLEAVIRRVRADGRITHARCAIVKACITRRRRVVAGPGGQPQEVPVSLNKDGPAPYQLGRLFAALEKTQADALGDVGSSIRDRYFGTASATPATVFPRLIRLTQHHLGKLSEGHRISREKLMQEVCSHVQSFPRHLNLEDQGLFQIGYYHQRQDMFTKNAKNGDPESTQET